MKCLELLGLSIILFSFWVEREIWKGVVNDFSLCCMDGILRKVFRRDKKTGKQGKG